MREHDDLGLLPGTVTVERHGRSARRRRGSAKRGRRVVTLLVALLLVAAGAFGASAALRPVISSLTAGDDYSGEGSGTVEVTIAAGAIGKTIARTLADADVVKSAGAFVDAFAADPSAASIQPGTYALRHKMSGAAAVSLLLDPAARRSEKVTVREGLRATEVLALLAKATGTPPAAYTAALKDPQSLGLPAAAKGRVEGWLFPASYSFEPRATADEQLSQMVDQTRRTLAAAGVSAKDAQRVLTIASIAEVEAASPADYAKVARTIENRLRIRMRLQLDSTVSYAVGKRTVTTTAAERASRSPFNTYLAPALPPGPISNPGKAAIRGAHQPAAGPWLYFVTVDPGTGETRFAATAAEHAKNVALFQRWCRAHADAC